MTSCNSQNREVRQQVRKEGNITGKNKSNDWKKSVRHRTIYVLKHIEKSQKGQLQRKEYNQGNWL